MTSSLRGFCQILLIAAADVCSRRQNVQLLPKEVQDEEWSRQPRVSDEWRIRCIGSFYHSVAAVGCKSYKSLGRHGRPREYIEH